MSLIEVRGLFSDCFIFLLAISECVKDNVQIIDYKKKKAVCMYLNWLGNPVC